MPLSQYLIESNLPSLHWYLSTSHFLSILNGLGHFWQSCYSPLNPAILILSDDFIAKATLFLTSVPCSSYLLSDMEVSLCLSLHFINVCCMFWMPHTQRHLPGLVSSLSMFFLSLVYSQFKSMFMRTWSFPPLLQSATLLFSLFSFSFSPPVLMTLGYYNKTPYTQWIIRAELYFSEF